MLKIRFDYQTHRLLNTPPDLKDLLSKVHQLFGETLPPYWTLEYPDTDNDYVVLDNEEEYKLLLQQLPYYTKTPTIYIQPRPKPALQGSYSVIEDLKDSKNQQEKTLPPSSELILQEEPRPQELDSSSLSELSGQSELVEKPKEPVEEELEIDLKPAVEELESQLHLQDPVLKMDSSQKEPEKEEEWEDPLKELRQAILKKAIAEQESRAKEEEAKIFNEKVINVIFEQLPLIVSHVEKRLEEKKLLESQASMSCVHEVQCSGCQKFPIVGTRYQCMVCQDFNFCEQCEESQDHMHPFAKLKRRGQQDFLGQSLNSSRFNASIYQRKEPVYQAEIKYPPGLMPSIDVTKSVMMKSFEEKKSDEKKNDILSSKILPESFMEISQKIPHKKVAEKISCEKLSLGKTIEMVKGGPVKDKNGQGKDLGEKDMVKIEERVRMLREVFGGEKETLVRFVRENKDLEIDLLCEKYLILDLK